MIVETEDLMSNSMVAELFDVNPQTVSMWISRGKMPEPVIIAGRKLWFRDQMEELAALQQQDLIEQAERFERRAKALRAKAERR